MNSSSEYSDSFSDGSCGNGFSGFMSSTPKRSSSRIFSPNMPKQLQRSKSTAKSLRNIYSSGAETESITAAVGQPVRRRTRQKTQKLRSYASQRMTVAIGVMRSTDPVPEANVASFEDECKSDEPIYGCHICSKKFYHESAKIAHELLHTSTLPRKKFLPAPRENLQRRCLAKQFAAINVEEPLPKAPRKPVILKSPVRKVDLELSLQAVDKPHKCTVCNKKFARKASMRIHQAKRHFHTREFLLVL